MEWLWWFVVSAVTCAVAEPHSNVLVSLNTFKRLGLVSDNFLSLTVSPRQLLTVDNISETTMSLLESLAPAYLQVGGVDSDNFTLQTLDSEKASTNLTFTESQWTRLNLLAADTGLSLVFTLSTNISPHEFHTLLSVSDKQGFNPTYQYGFEMSPQHHQNVETLRGKIAELRRTLDSFPRYRETALLCPDIQVDDDATYAQELHEFLAQPEDVPPIFILQGKTSEVKNERDIVENLREPTAFMSKVFHEEANKTQTVQTEKKYQLWIAASEDAKKKEREGSWSQAVVWTLRLGHAARLGYQTLLWHPTQLTKPTLEYWVSLLHRRLVGGAVLNTRVVSGSSSGVSVFAHCTAQAETQDGARGAVTVWGVNLAHQSTSVTLLTTYTPRINVYSLTLRDREPLLNGHRLSLSHGALPKLSPEVRQLSGNLSVDLAPHSIFFLVLPDLRARACLSPLATPGNKEVSNLFWQKPAATSSKNFIVEKGGIFQNSEDDLLKNSNLNDQLKNIQKIIEEDPNPAASFKTVEKVKDDTRDWLDKLAIVNKSGILTQDEMQTLTELIIDERPPESRNSDVSESIDKIKSDRFKRSGDEETAQLLSNRLSLPVSSPLFRKLYFLRKSRPLDLSSLHLPKGLGEINPTIETKTEEPTRNQIVTSSAKPNSLIDASEKSKLDKNKQFTTKSKNEESESIHYYPGEFYEMLGSLKIQSDVPLKDLTVSHEAIDSILSEELNCKDCESKMQVIKKGGNGKKEDDKVTENAAENLRAYFIKGEMLKPSFDFSAGKKNSLLDQKHQPETLNSESMETKVNKEVPSNIPQRQMFSNSELRKNVAMQTRSKRDIDSYEYITSIFQNDSKEDKSNSSTINSSEEKELRQFLEELTVEGEELLEDFNENIEKDTTYLKYNSQVTKPKDTISSENHLTNNEDYFLRNNLVVEEKPKTRRTYSPRLVLVSQNSLDQKNLDNDWKTVKNQMPKEISKVKTEELATEKIPEVSQAVTFIRTTEKTPEDLTVEDKKQTLEMNLPLPSPSDEQIKPRKEFTANSEELSKQGLSDDKTEVVRLNYYPTVAEPLEKQDLPTNVKTEVVELKKYPTVEYFSESSGRDNKVGNGFPKYIVPKPGNSQPIGNLQKNTPEDGVHSSEQFTTASSHNGKEYTFKSKVPLIPKFNRNFLHRYLNPLAASTTHLGSFQSSPSSTDKDKEMVDSSEVEVETPPLLKLILANRRKNRLDSIRQRIEKARERMVRLPKPRNLPAVKPIKKEDVPKKTTFPVEIEPAVEIPNSADKKIFERKKRQVPEDHEKGKLAVEETTLASTINSTVENKTVNISTTTEIPTPTPTSVVDHISEDHLLAEELPIDDVLIESSQVPLQKWIIPLSNHTEKIILKNQIFPVKLYGILHNDWAREKNKSKSNDVLDRHNKEKRSIRYSCIKDRFYDDEGEEETQVVNAKKASKKPEPKMSPSEIIEVKLPKEKKFTEITPILILSPENSHRTKRSTTDKVRKPENKFYGLLTNEIIKEGPIRDGESDSQEQNDSSSQKEEEEEGESDFSIMLRKSVKEVAAHKGGIERMLELAKEYKKTNPDSLEIFDIHKKDISEKLKQIHSHKIESKSENKIESENGDKVEALEKDKKYFYSESVSDEKSKLNKKKNKTDTNESDSSQENFFSSFVNKTKEYFNNINFFQKSSDNNVKNSQNYEVDKPTNLYETKSSNSTPENILSSIFNKSKDFLQNVTTYIEKSWDSDSKIEDD